MRQKRNAHPVGATIGRPLCYTFCGRGSFKVSSVKRSYFPFHSQNHISQTQKRKVYKRKYIRRKVKGAGGWAHKPKQPTARTQLRQSRKPYKASAAHPLQDLPGANLDGAALYRRARFSLDFGFLLTATRPHLTAFGAGASYAFT